MPSIKFLRHLASIAAVVVIGAASSVSAQDSKGSAAATSAVAVKPSTESVAKTTTPAAGAYRRLSPRSADVKAAYAFAVKSQSEAEKKDLAFVKVLKAESQVVAGTNYRICMLVREGKSRSKSVTVVVNRDLQNEFSVAQWVPGGCKDI